MKTLNLIFSLLLLAAISFAQTTSLETFLKSQQEVKSVKQLQGNDFFTASYKIMLEQPVDHNDPKAGTFLQRVIIADKGIENPVVLITEGYNGEYAERSSYINELSPMLNSNQICVEHRYFGESWPEPLNWDYLTVRNAAADHHKIVELMKGYYKGKWINTGISKGGQTVIYHRWLYPSDVDISIPYVCPLNFGVEDGRHEPFLANVPGTEERRNKIESFQLHILKNRTIILPKLQDYCNENNYTFRIGMNEVLDYCVLEYPFALWQWGQRINEIPTDYQNIDQLFNHLMQVSGPSYFSIEGQEGIKSFFIQAAKELGYYGYNTKPFKKYLTIRTAKGYLNRIFIPEDVDIKYQKKTAKAVEAFIKSTNSKILFIYGAWDPWSASAFEVPNKDNFLKIVKPSGSHSTRINNLPEYQKKKVKETLDKWLNYPVNIN